MHVKIISFLSTSVFFYVEREFKVSFIQTDLVFELFDFGVPFSLQCGKILLLIVTLFFQITFHIFYLYTSLCPYEGSAP